MLQGRIIKDKYLVEKRLGKGGMGSVYLCKNLELDNYWALKFIPKSENMQLLAEEEILKKLNHISLPKIVDVFYDEAGTYIIETYIEGESLKDKIERESYFTEETVADWAKQLSEVLIYLHNMKPYPIIYRDMKPSNIMVTDYNKVVLVDFGISTQSKDAGKSGSPVALTKNYAAPEQMKGQFDVRTDIYSLGITMYQLLTGNLPENRDENISIRSKGISNELKSIVEKCLKYNPKDRYQNAEELRNDLDQITTIKVFKSTRAAYQRKLLITGIILCSLTTYFSSFMGLKILNREKTVMLDLSHNILMLSEQQSAEFQITKKYKDGEESPLDNKKIQWISDNENIAKVSEGKVIGINKGETEIHGRYKNKSINLKVFVSNRKDQININLKYDKDYYVDIVDTKGQADALYSPSGIASDSKGNLYVIEQFQPYINRIKDGAVETFMINPGHITPKIIRINAKDQIYFASEVWETSDSYRIGIFKYEEDGIELIYENDGELLSFEDFAFDSQGNIIIIEKDNNSRLPYSLIKLHIDEGVYEYLAKDLEDISNIALDDKDNIYLSSSGGVIFKYNGDDSSLEYFAGIYNDRQFIDGNDSRLYEPRKILYKDNNLYVADVIGNQYIIRKLKILKGLIMDTETIAGNIVEDRDLSRGEGSQVLLGSAQAESYATITIDMTMDDQGNLYIVDTKNNHVKIIYKKEPQTPIQLLSWGQGCDLIGIHISIYCSGFISPQYYINNFSHKEYQKHEKPNLLQRYRNSYFKPKSQTNA
jgi:serine/threonine protein kinase